MNSKNEKISLRTPEKLLRKQNTKKDILLNIIIEEEGRAWEFQVGNKP